MPERRGWGSRQWVDLDARLPCHGMQQVVIWAALPSFTLHVWLKQCCCRQLRVLVPKQS